MTNIKRFWSRVKKSPKCWEWIGYKTADGYGQYYHVGAHRIAYYLAHGNIPMGMCVLHRCDNPVCVNPEHLFIGTDRDNVLDMISKKRGAYYDGRSNGDARKLSECQVLEIRKFYKSGNFTQAELGRKYKTDKSNVGSIVKGKTWRHLVAP